MVEEHHPFLAKKVVVEEHHPLLAKKAVVDESNPQQEKGKWRKTPLPFLETLGKRGPLPIHSYLAGE